MRKQYTPSAQFDPSLGKVGRTCPQCERVFYVSPAHLRRYPVACCSRACSGLLQRRPKPACVICGEPFTPHNPGQQSCSNACGHKVRYPQAAEERFWAKVDRSGRCWLWRGGTNRKGYGVFVATGKKGTLAHRFAWGLSNGPIPDGLKVLHNCPDGDNPACCNPAHLWLGTEAENSKDMVEKGRSCRGERHPAAKLTEAQVLEIRRLHSKKTPLAALAALFDTNQKHIESIVYLKAWRHLLPALAPE